MLAAAVCLAIPACRPHQPVGRDRLHSSHAETASRSGESTTLYASPAGSHTAVAVVWTYRKLQAAVVAAFAHPRRSPTQVARFAYGKERGDIYTTVLQYRSQHIHLTGRPRISPHVETVDSRRGTATVTDCFDDRHWIPVDTRTGRSIAAPGVNRRYPVTAQLRRIDGRWYVTASRPDRGQTCTPD